MSSKVLATSFFESLKNRDYKKISAYYAVNAVYSNKVFPGLSGFEAGKMWQMLLTSAKVLKIDYKILKADRNKAKVSWLMAYSSSKTGRSFTIKVTSFMEFEGEKIYTHEDRFNFSNWVRQTYGWLPWMFQFTGITKKKIQEKLEHHLNNFIQQNP